MGVPWGYRVVWSIQGLKLANDFDSTVTAINNVQNSYLAQGFNLVLEDDNGTPLKMLSQTASHNGLKITVIPGWPNGGGAELVGYASYSLQAEADYLLTSPPLYDSWTETVQFRGGGPLRAVFPTTNGAPVVQILRKQMPYFCTQSGTVVGLLTKPPLPPPLFSTSLYLEDPQVSETSPQRDNRGLRGYTLNYTYQFGSPTKLVGGPKNPPL